METTGLPLFSAEALAVLNRMLFDSVARGSFEIMSGSLIWTDEFPCHGSPEWEAIAPNWVYGYLVAYRAALTLGKERAEFRPVWEQVLRHAPNWPGLRPERRGEKSRHRLKAALRNQEKCLAEWESQVLKASRSGEQVAGPDNV